MSALDELLKELERERDDWHKLADERAAEIVRLTAELRKYEPSDGVMHRELAFIEAIAAAKDIVGKLKAEEFIGLDDVNRWLALPVVKATQIVKATRVKQ